MKCIVTKSTGSIFTVVDDSGREMQVRVKGKLRLEGCRSTSPVAVGDVVEVEGETIGSIHERRNYIIRKASNLSKESQILAANLDQALLVVTVKMPETATEFIDRFLVTAYAYRVPVIIAFNKVDICDESDMELIDALTNLYQGSLGYKCVKVSTKRGDGIDELKELLKGKTTLLSGNSGVGKSSVINAIDPSFAAKTAAISDVHLTGMHTTTFSEMFPYEGGYVIDTPGIKGFGTIDMKPEEVSHYFPEIFRTAEGCRFSNCLHIDEPHCAVTEAVRNHLISESRYNSYLSIMQDASQGKYR